MKRVLVTGGSRGIGLAICRGLLAEGCLMITNYREPSSELIELAREYPHRLQHHAVDLAQPGAIADLAKAANVLEGLDGYVASAAVSGEGLLMLTDESVIRQCVEVNLVAPMLLAREVLKGMLTKGGSLIFIASVAARTGIAGLSVYCATKGAVVAFSKSLAREYGERGIRSNCILPGFMETAMNSSMDEKQREQVTRRTALKRLGQPDDVAGCVSFLLSDHAKYITGTEIVVDGGMLA